jgi:hypothetical protein
MPKSEGKQECSRLLDFETQKLHTLYQLLLLLPLLFVLPSQLLGFLLELLLDLHLFLLDLLSNVH